MCPVSTSPLRILTFGASLIRGHTDGGLRATPFAPWMQKRLLEKWPDKEENDVRFTVNGVSGSMATLWYKRRMEEVYEDYETTSTAPLFDWVVLLGGTNDLAYNKPPGDIFDALTTVFNIPLENGAKILLCTVPECAVRHHLLDKNRDELNTLIRESSQERGGLEGVYVFDLCKKIPYHAMPEEERREIWDDGLHFTPKGYERFGELVAERLAEIIDGEKEGVGEGPRDVIKSERGW